MVTKTPEPEELSFDDEQTKKRQQIMNSMHDDPEEFLLRLQKERDRDKRRGKRLEKEVRFPRQLQPPLPSPRS